MSKRMTESQIIGVLKEAEAGLSISEVCRKHGIGQSTFYKWRSKNGGMEAQTCNVLKSSKKRTDA